MQFLRGPWGFIAFLVAFGFLMLLGFKAMKMLDSKKSSEETYHPPR